MIRPFLLGAMRAQLTISRRLSGAMRSIEPGISCQQLLDSGSTRRRVSRNDGELIQAGHPSSPGKRLLHEARGVKRSGVVAKSCDHLHTHR